MRKCDFFFFLYYILFVIVSYSVVIYSLTLNNSPMIFKIKLGRSYKLILLHTAFLCYLIFFLFVHCLIHTYRNLIKSYKTFSTVCILVSIWRNTVGSLLQPVSEWFKKTSIALSSFVMYPHQSLIPTTVLLYISHETICHNCFTLRHTNIIFTNDYRV